MKGEKGKRARDKARKEVLKAGEVKAKQTILEVLCGLERERNARGTKVSGCRDKGATSRGEKRWRKTQNAHQREADARRTKRETL
jgi:hypothetical protein